MAQRAFRADTAPIDPSQRNPWFAASLKLLFDTALSGAKRKILHLIFA
jgi:hypothetical protein